MNPADVIADYLGAMEAAGIRPVEPIASRLGHGDLVRFQAEGDKPGRQNGWAILHIDDHPAGAFGSWRLGIRETWSAQSGITLSGEERQRLRREWRAKQEQRERERRQGWEMAAEVAKAMLTNSLPANPDHPYLVRKGISPEGLRQGRDLLLVPMFDIDGHLWNVQRISADGKKLFVGKGRTEGLFWLCGAVESKLCIGEGCSTMGAVRVATGLPVVVAFSAKNLATVARLWRDHRPDLDLIICGDDDPELVDNPHVRQNVGLEAARAAAEEVGGRLALPPREVRRGN